MSTHTWQTRWKLKAGGGSSDHSVLASLSADEKFFLLASRRLQRCCELIRRVWCAAASGLFTEDVLPKRGKTLESDVPRMTPQSDLIYLLFFLDCAFITLNLNEFHKCLTLADLQPASRALVYLSRASFFLMLFLGHCTTTNHTDWWCAAILSQCVTAWLQLFALRLGAF